MHWQAPPKFFSERAQRAREGGGGHGWRVRAQLLDVPLQRATAAEEKKKKLQHSYMPRIEDKGCPGSLRARACGGRLPTVTRHGRGP